MKKGKRGISPVIAYTLLILMGVAAAAVGFQGLKAISIPKEVFICPTETDIVIRDYRCSLNESICLSFENKGKFKADGYFVFADNNTIKSPNLYTINDSGNTLVPAQKEVISYEFPIPLIGALGSLSNVTYVDIQPFVLDEKGNKVLCDTIISKEIYCEPTGPDCSALICDSSADCSDDGLSCTNEQCDLGFCNYISNCPLGEICFAGNSSCIPGAGGCSAHSECDDSNECTQDICGAGSCYNNPLTGSPCAGGSGVCNSTGSCVINPTSLLVGYWNFNEGTGTIAGDYSGYNNNGTLENGPIWSEGVNETYGLDFDGVNDRVKVLDSPSLSLTGNNLTLETWIKPDMLSPWVLYILIHKEGQYSLALNGPYITYADSVTWNYATIGYYGNVSLGYWNHIAVTYDGSTIRFYLNGLNVGNKTRPGSLTDNSNPVCIGSYNCTLGAFFNGSIDEVKIYNMTLNQSEIAKHAAWNSPATEAPIANYTFDTGSGTIAYDLSGNSHDGSLEGGTTWSTETPSGSGYSVSFDGSGDLISIPYNSQMNLNREITIKAWVYPTVHNSWKAFFNNWNGSSVYFGNNFGKTRFNIDRFTFLDSPNTLPLNKWTKLWVMYNGTDMKIFENGVEVAQRSTNVPVGTSNVSWIFGRQADSSVSYYTGYIDEVVLWDKGFGPPTPVDTVFVEDSYPLGASPFDDPPNWTNSNPPGPQSGSLFLSSRNAAGVHQQYFTGASPTFQVNTGDIIYFYVYLNPVSSPSTVMMQFNNGNWEHRAYWGQDLFSLGVNGTESRYFMGGLPSTGKWVRLEVPASYVGIEGTSLNGVAFSLVDGQANWDNMGKCTKDCFLSP